MATPTSTTEYTPLDTLKETFSVVRNLIELVQEAICDDFDDDSAPQRLLDSANSELIKAISRHVPGISESNIGLLVQTPAGHREINTYDDGTPVKIAVTASTGHMISDFYPRRDGARWAFEERLNDEAQRHHAQAVEYERLHPSMAEEI